MVEGGHPDRQRPVTLLFIGPLPEPLTGQSLACQILVAELVMHYRVEIVNLSNRALTQPRGSLGRIADVVKIVFDVWRKRKYADAIYLTISESYAGNLKDLLIYLACFRQLSRMAIHLYGGAGLRGIMLTPRHPLRKINEYFLRRLGGAIVEGRRQVPTFANALPSAKIHVVPNFAEDYLFADVESIDRRFRNVKPLRILFLSNLLPGKGFLELIEAFTTLEESVAASVELDLAGGFLSEAERRSFLDRIDGLERVRYHGSVRAERKRALFHQAHVFCLPTYYPYEGQPISILEAYASGCAVITTDHSGIGDVFVHERNGYQVAKRSSVELKAAIEKAVAAPDHLRVMALANLESAQQNYRTANYRNRMIPIIDSLVRGQGE